MESQKPQGPNLKDPQHSLRDFLWTPLKDPQDSSKDPSQGSTRFLQRFLVDRRAMGSMRWRSDIHDRVWMPKFALELQDSLWEGMDKAQSCSLPQGGLD